MSTPHPWLHSAFYRFAPLRDPAAVALALRQHCQALLGNILVAGEGINGVVAGSAQAVHAFEATLLDDPVYEAAFTGMAFKHSGCLTPPFARMKVRLKPELVALGLPGVTGLQAQPDPLMLSPAAWRQLLAEDELVLIDNRNSFEYRLGHFQGAIDPQVHNFRDFAAYLSAHMPAWQAEGKKVAMYCTGGIRCEKLGPWLQQQGLPGYQLEGGILNYCQSLDDAAREWQGECFVFDNRVALDARLQETPTTAEQVYDPAVPDEAWRLTRAQRLALSVNEAAPPTPS